jgi:hypothetical protein
MKCDELEKFDAASNADLSAGYDHRYAYEADEVDAAIAELKVRNVMFHDEAKYYKAENESLKAKLETVNELVKTSKDMYDRTIESLKASHYADSVDAGMRERRLRRALWLARALRARDIQRWWIAATCSKTTERACRVWNNIEIKCLKKAEEYK